MTVQELINRLQELVDEDKGYENYKVWFTGDVETEIESAELYDPGTEDGCVVLEA